MSAHQIPGPDLPKAVIDYFEKLAGIDSSELTSEQKKVADEFSPLLRGLRGRELLGVFVRRREQKHPLAQTIRFAKEGDIW